MDVEEEEFAKLRLELEQCGQGHIFHEFDSETDDEMAERFALQLLKLNSTTPGGLKDYCQRGKRILTQQHPINLSDIQPPPLGDVLTSHSPQFEECQELGWREIPYIGFVLVAGGLGERLGFPKTQLETDLLTQTNMLHFHLQVVLAIQTRAREMISHEGENYYTPFVIMTSESNHSIVLDILAQSTSQSDLLHITLVKQSEVACFRNQTGLLEIRDFLSLVTKPHGHGDVHDLLYKTKLPHKFLSEQHTRHLVFFQDTNLVGFHSILAAVGNSVRRDMAVNFVCVERSNGNEPMGLVCQTKSLRTQSIEYNLLDKQRDYGTQFPGNINLLIMALGPYCQVLDGSKGICPEFINPKFKSGSGEFASPARLECLMQDFVLAYPLTARIGYTQMERWLAYSPMKNNPLEAITKYQETGFAASPASCEGDFYHTNRLLLAMTGVQIKTHNLNKRRFLNIPFEEGTRVVLLPSFALTMAEMRSRFPTPHLVTISDRSSLIIEGDVIIHELNLDGHLKLTATGLGSRLIIVSLHVQNAGTELLMLPTMMDGFTANEKIRGFTTHVKESLDIVSKSGSEVFVNRPRH
ncbi:hypothetical protein BASA81_009875 [Batrachochytrium salamandrivorans]|nr:hypothetical protein BASA81_009875 [Batrachochytrium salamandrivorans]